MPKTSTHSPSLIKNFNLWKLWKARLSYPLNAINFWLRILSAILAIAISSLTCVSNDFYTKTARTLLSSGASVGLSLLGLLLAGYVIFITVARKDLLINMAKHKEEYTGLNYLEYNLVPHIVVLIDLLLYSTFCVIAGVLFADKGLICTLSDRYPNSNLTTIVLPRCVFGLAFCGTLLILVSLKTVIRNVHYSVMTAMEWEILREENCKNNEE